MNVAVELYFRMSLDLLPTSTKSHYVFTFSYRGSIVDVHFNPESEKLGFAVLSVCLCVCVLMYILDTCPNRNTNMNCGCLGGGVVFGVAVSDD